MYIWWPLKKIFIVPDLILPAFLAKSSISNNFSLHFQSVSKFSSPQSPLLLIFLNPIGHLNSPESSLISGCWPAGRTLLSSFQSQLGFIYLLLNCFSNRPRLFFLLYLTFSYHSEFLPNWWKILGVFILCTLLRHLIVPDSFFTYS